MPTTAAVLNPSQVFILQALAKSNGMTREALEKEVGPEVPCSSENLGPAYKETLESNAKYAGSLWGLGYARPIYDEVDGVMVPLWYATPKGRQVAARLKTRERARKKDKVDPAILDPVVLKFRTNRTYQFELYTDEDMRAIKSVLGKHAEGISLDALRCQIVARRKQGAFADPVAKIRKAIERTIREFGPEGTILPVLTPAQLDQLERHCVNLTGESSGDGFPGEDE